MGSLLAAELLKMRKRWLPYGLLLFMIGGTAIIIWLGGYADWQGSEDAEFKQSALRAFAMPYSIPALLDSGQFWGSVFVAVLVASVVATEYNWGTVRQALIRGQSRTQYVLVKLAALVLFSALSLLVALGVGIGFSVLATSLADLPITLDVLDGPSFAEVILMVLRAGYAVIPYGMLAFCLAVVGRSTAIGAAGVMAYVIAESIAIAIFNESSISVLRDLRDVLPGHHAQALIGANRIGSGDYNHLSFRELPVPSELPDPNFAAFVLGLWSLALLSIALYVFRRRDLKT